MLCVKRSTCSPHALALASALWWTGKKGKKCRSKHCAKLTAAEKKQARGLRCTKCKSKKCRKVNKCKGTPRKPSKAVRKCAKCGSSMCDASFAPCAFVVLCCVVLYLTARDVVM